MTFITTHKRSWEREKNELRIRNSAERNVKMLIAKTECKLIKSLEMNFRFDLLSFEVLSSNTVQIINDSTFIWHFGCGVFAWNEMQADNFVLFFGYGLFFQWFSGCAHIRGTPCVLLLKRNELLLTRYQTHQWKKKANYVHFKTWISVTRINELMILWKVPFEKQENKLNRGTELSLIGLDWGKWPKCQFLQQKFKKSIWNRTFVIGILITYFKS